MYTRPDVWQTQLLQITHSNGDSSYIPWSEVPPVHQSIITKYSTPNLDISKLLSTQDKTDLAKELALLSFHDETKYNEICGFVIKPTVWIGRILYTEQPNLVWAETEQEIWDAFSEKYDYCSICHIERNWDVETQYICNCTYKLQMLQVNKPNNMGTYPIFRLYRLGDDLTMGYYESRVDAIKYTQHLQAIGDTL